MKKKGWTCKEIEKKAATILGQYLYLDGVPIDGWMWEFCRRSNEYIDLYNCLKQKYPEEERGVTVSFKRYELLWKDVAPDDDREYWSTVDKCYPNPDLKYCDLPDTS